MRWLVIATALLGGCASVSGPDRDLGAGPAILIAAGDQAVGQDVAAYVRIANGSGADRLVSVSCTCADRVEIHNSSAEGMHVLPHLDLPADETTDIRPGGATHLMLMNMKVSLQPGETVRMLLTFESGAKLETDFTGVANPRVGWDAATGAAG
jgi:copper(I)-binding protein